MFLWFVFQIRSIINKKIKQFILGIRLYNQVQTSKHIYNSITYQHWFKIVRTSFCQTLLSIEKKYDWKILCFKCVISKKCLK